MLAGNLLSIDEKIAAMALEIAELRLLKSSTAPTVPAIVDISNNNLAALIRSQIAMYDADKTNLPDYALESSGLSIEFFSKTCHSTEDLRWNNFDDSVH
jgi:hypothetical protein